VDDHTPDALPEPSPDVVWRRLNDEVVLVHLPTNRIFSLNATGARLWELLSEDGSRAAIEERIRKEFGVTREEVTAAVEALISELLRERLVRARSTL